MAAMTEGDPALVGVLALQGAFAAHEVVLAALGARTRRVRSARDLEGLDGIVFPGGESTTMCKLLLEFDLFEELRARLRSGLPVLGTCAGMILLADEIIDGRPDQVGLGVMGIGVRRNGYGRQVDSFETELDIAGLDHPFPAIFIRAPIIERCDPSVEVLASQGGRACLVRQGSAMAASFHPELTDDRAVHELFLEMIRDRDSAGCSNTSNTVSASEKWE